MTIWSRLSNALTAFASKAAPQGYGGYYNSGPVFTDAFRSRRAPSPVELVEAYKSVAYACAQINAGALVKVPLRLYVTTSRGQATPKCATAPNTSHNRARTKALAKRHDVAKYLTKAEDVKEVADHPILQAIVNANPDFDQTVLLKYTSLALDVTGNAFWVPDEFKLGVPTALWPLQSQYVLPLRSSSTLQVDAWQYYGQTYQPDELIRFRMVSLKDPYGVGYGPLQAAFEHARLHDSYTSVQDSLLSQGVRPSVIVSPKDPAMPMTGPERARFEADINRKLSGGGSGRAWVTDGSIDVHPLTFPPSDLAALDISDNALERFANCFGVPLALLQTENVNLANLEAGLKQHAMFSTEPRCVEIAGALTRWVHNAGKSLRSTEGKDRSWDRLFFAFDNPVKEDVEQNTKVFDMDLKNGTRTINEVRTERGEEPVSWGDEPWLPGTLVQPSTMAAREERTATQAEHGMALAEQMANQELSEDTEDDPKDDKKKYAKGYKDWLPESLGEPFTPAERLEAWGLGSAIADALGYSKEWANGTLTQDQSHKIVEVIAEGATSKLRGYAEELLIDITPTKGFKDSVNRFFSRATKVVRTAFLTASIAILGPGQPITPAEERFIQNQLKTQGSYLDNFRKDVSTGKQPTDGTLVSRAGMYGSSTWGASQNVGREVATAGGAVEERRTHVGADDPCQVCHEQQDRGWVPIGTLNMIGDSYCRCNCHCHFTYRDEEGNVYETYAQLRANLIERGPVVFAPIPGNEDQQDVEEWRGPTPNTEIERRLKEYTEGDRKIAELARGMRNPDIKRRQYLEGLKWMEEERAAGRKVDPDSVKLINKALEDASRIREANTQKVIDYLKAKNPVACMADVDKIRAKGDKAWIEKTHNDVWAMMHAKKDGETAFDVAYRFTRASDGADRAFWDPKSETVVLSKLDGTAVVAHELGHKLESQYPKVQKLANEFVEYRKGDEKPKKMTHCDDDEMGIDDDFKRVYPTHPRYVGKRYETGETEVIAIGIQTLIENPHRLILSDPEYGKLILGILDGTFR